MVSVATESVQKCPMKVQQFVLPLTVCDFYTRKFNHIGRSKKIWSDQ